MERRVTPDLSPHICIMKPKDALGGILTEIRSRPDSRKIEPVTFKAHASGPQSIVFNIAFERDDEARRFKQTFAPEAAPSSAGEALRRDELS